MRRIKFSNSSLIQERGGLEIIRGNSVQLKANHMGTDNRKKNLHQLLASMLNAALCIYTGGVGRESGRENLVQGNFEKLIK